MTVSSTLSPGLDEKLDEPARGAETGNPPERSRRQANLEEDRSMISLIRAIPGSRLLSGLIAADQGHRLSHQSEGWESVRFSNDSLLDERSQYFHRSQSGGGAAEPARRGG